CFRRRPESVRVTTQVRERSSPTQKGIRISSAEQSRTCISRRLPAKSESAASLVTTLPSNRWPHRAVRLAKKASCADAGASAVAAAGAAGSDEQAERARPAARTAAERAGAGLKQGFFMAKH